MNGASCRTELIYEPDCFADMSSFVQSQDMLMLILLIFNLGAKLIWQLTVRDDPTIQLIAATRDRLAQTATVQLARLPIACEKTLLHFNVAFDDGRSICRVKHCDESRNELLSR